MLKQSHLKNDKTQSVCSECERNNLQSESIFFSNEDRIATTPKNQPFHHPNSYLEQRVNLLQQEVENLKKQNSEKDRQIFNLKRKVEDTVSYKSLLGEISKQGETLKTLKNELHQKKHESKRISFLADNQIADNSKEFVRQRRQKNMYERKMQDKKMWERYYSSVTNKDKSRQSKSKSKQSKVKTKQPFSKEYYGVYPPAKVHDAKKQLSQLYEKLKFYEEEIAWMTNFVVAFVKVIGEISWKKYNEEILVKEWGLKKKSKVCWRYLKHLLIHFCFQ